MKLSKRLRKARKSGDMSPVEEPSASGGNAAAAAQTLAVPADKAKRASSSSSSSGAAATVPRATRCVVSQLPLEMMMRIFERLPVDDVVRARAVSRQFRDSADAWLPAEAREQIRKHNGYHKYSLSCELEKYVAEDGSVVYRPIRLHAYAQTTYWEDKVKYYVAFLWTNRPIDRTELWGIRPPHPIARMLGRWVIFLRDGVDYRVGETLTCMAPDTSIRQVKLTDIKPSYELVDHPIAAGYKEPSPADPLLQFQESRVSKEQPEYQQPVRLLMHHGLEVPPLATQIKKKDFARLKDLLAPPTVEKYKGVPDAQLPETLDVEIVRSPWRPVRFQWMTRSEYDSLDQSELSLRDLYEGQHILIVRDHAKMLELDTILDPTGKTLYPRQENDRISAANIVPATYVSKVNAFYLYM